MSLWEKLCCCVREKKLTVTENTRLLPRSEEDKKQDDKTETPYIVFAYGVIPPDLQFRHIPSEFSREGIKKIACGAEHILLLTFNNYVMTCGNNKFGQCARLPEVNPETKPEKKLETKPEKKPEKKPKSESESEDSLENLEPEILIEKLQVDLSAFNIENSKILDIAAGAYHSLLLVRNKNSFIGGSAQGRVMAFGHELGCGFIDKQHKYIPTEIEIQIGVQSPMESANKIFAGHNRSAVILDSGKLFMWGEWFNAAKQRCMREIKFKLEKNDRIKKVAIGKLHSLLVTENGKVYSWGDNTYGELGLGRNIRGKDSPIQLGGDIRNLNFLDIAAGARHSLILEENGRIFSFGDNSEGQCAIDNRRAYTPIEIQTRGLLGEDKVKSRFIFCGDSHSAVLTDDGDMFAWGDNSAGRLGMASMSSVYKPTLVDDLMGRNIVSIGLGGFFSVAITGPSSQALIHRHENLLSKEVFKQAILKTFTITESQDKHPRIV